MCQMITVNTNFGSTVTVADIKKDSIENIISAAADCPKIDEVILFGSSLEERCREDSDIDIAIISNVPRSVLYKNKSYDRFTTKLYQKKVGQDYDILQFNSLESLKNNSAYICQEILKKGQRIYKRA